MEERYEIVKTFSCTYASNCLDCHIRIRVGAKAHKVRRADNPMIGVPGVLCGKCGKGVRRVEE